LHSQKDRAALAFEQEFDRVIGHSLVRGASDGDDEERLAQVVDLLGGEIYPPGGGITYRDFLEKISSLT
jgi:hypothetical protein